MKQEETSAIIGEKLELKQKKRKMWSAMKQLVIYLISSGHIVIIMSIGRRAIIERKQV